MNPSGSEFTLRVAICDLVERLKRMQHKCSYLEECRNQLVKEVIRLRIQNEWLAKQMNDAPAGVSGGGGGGGTGGGMGAPGMSNLPSDGQANHSSAAQCFCQASSLVNSSANTSATSHQPNCPFFGSVSAPGNTEQVIVVGGETYALVNGDNINDLLCTPVEVRNRNSNTGPGVQTPNSSQQNRGGNMNVSTATTAINANTNINSSSNNTNSDESLHLMNILNQFEQEDATASKENSIKNLTIQMLKELESEMRTGKLKNDLIELVHKNTNGSLNSSKAKAQNRRNPHQQQPQQQQQQRDSSDDLYSAIECDFVNSDSPNSPRKPQQTNVKSSIGCSDVEGSIGSGGTTTNNNNNINDSLGSDNPDYLINSDSSLLLNEDELISLVNIIRKEMRTLQHDIQSSTDRLGKIKERNEDEKFRFYFQKQIKSDNVNAANSSGQTLSINNSSSLGLSKRPI